VVDAAGNPVENADVSFSYQLSKSFSDSDGQLSGKTNLSGTYFANLTNVVGEGIENRLIRISISHYYGGNITINETAGSDPAEVKQIVYVVPFSVATLEVKVASANGTPIRGASVYLEGLGVKKYTDASGIAAFQVARGRAASGAVTYEGKAYPFSASGNGSMLAASVVVPEEVAIAEPGVAASLALQFVWEDGAPLAGLPVKFSYMGQGYPTQTDSGGMASFSTPQPGSEVNVTFTKNEIDYALSYLLANNRSETVKLGPSLKINSFYAVSQDENCFRLVANVSDPRAQLPIQVKMVKITPYANSTLPVSIEEGGVFSSSLCISYSVKAKFFVWNKYDFRESDILELKYSPPKPKLVFAPVEEKKDEEANEKVSFDDVLLAVATFAVIGAFLGIVIAGKSKIGRATQFIRAFLRQALKKLQYLGRRRRLPPKPKTPEVILPRKEPFGTEVPIDEGSPGEKD